MIDNTDLNCIMISLMGRKSSVSDISHQQISFRLHQFGILHFNFAMLSEFYWIELLVREANAAALDLSYKIRVHKLDVAVAGLVFVMDPEQVDKPICSSAWIEGFECSTQLSILSSIVLIAVLFLPNILISNSIIPF